MRWPTVKLEIPAWLAEDLAIGSDQLARGLGDCLSLFFKIGSDELLVVAAGNEADLLRIRLLGEREAALPCDFAYLGLGHAAEREEGVSKLLLREAEEEVGLILGEVGRALEDPTAADRIVFVDCVMAGGDAARRRWSGRSSKADRT